jgi:hypothetical protein
VALFLGCGTLIALNGQPRPGAVFGLVTAFIVGRKGADNPTKSELFGDN